ncbi:hypothetical protein [Treponema parvum]|uniref:hypothetical protein n=1 Tax=Treponema parvum TaxID=138851 RepID=UPI001AEBF942|nr:hypothetical protein [Treponema parvum]
MTLLGFRSNMGLQHGVLQSVSTLLAGITGAVFEQNLGKYVSTGEGTGYYTKVDGFNGKQIFDMKNFNSFAGNFATNAIGYGLTGTTSFNLLDIADLGLNVDGQKIHTGLLEYTVGGDNSGLHLGTGGTNVSFGTLASSLSGLNDWNTNRKIESRTSEMSMSGMATALRLQYGYGDSVQKQQLKDILAKRSVLEAGSGADGRRAQTISENGTRTVYIDNYSNNMSRKEMYEMGITLGHEAYRDGYNGDVDQQRLETVRAVAGHSNLALNIASDLMYSDIMKDVINGSENLQKDIGAYYSAMINKDASLFDNYVNDNYDSSGDYWKLMDNGSIAYDGLANLYDERGRLIYETSSKGIEGSLVEILYGKNANSKQIEIVRDMLEAKLAHTAKGDLGNKNRDSVQ